jgi:exopolysaccharide production protein ExoQ
VVGDTIFFTESRVVEDRANCWAGGPFFNEFDGCSYATRLGETWSVMDPDEPEQMREHTVKHPTPLPQAGQSAGPLSSVPRVNITRSHARSVRHKVLYAASVFFLLESMSALGVIDRNVYGEWYGKTGDKITETLNLLSILVSLYLFWSARKITIARFNHVLPLAAASIFLITILWSLDSRLSLTQGTAYFFLVLGAIGLVETFDNDELMDLIALICGLAAIASIVQFFIVRDPLQFRGIFPQKNALGQVMAVGVLTGLHCAQIKVGRRFRNISIIVLCTIVGFMSKSATSILAMGVFFWLGVLGRIYLKGGSFRILSICLAICCVPIVIFVLQSDLIFELFGKDSTLTGRTLFWPYVIDNISKKPLLGWGFYGFWSPQNPIALQIADAIKGDNWFTFNIVNAHNALLEFLLEIGFLGTSVFIFLLLRNFTMAVKCMNGPAGQIGLSSVLLLTGILLEGVSETVLLSHEQIWTSLFFIMGFMCEKKLWLARAARRQGRPRPRSMLAAIDISRSAIT